MTLRPISILNVTLLAAVTAAGPCPAARAETPAVLSLADALALASTTNKTIAAARLTQAIDTAGVDIAKERVNPDLRLEASRETPRQSLTLTLPVEFGKRGPRIEAATAAARAGEADTALAIAQVYADVRRAYDALATAQRKAAAASDTGRIAARVRSVAQQRFDLGDVAQLDVLEAELAALQTDTEATTLAGDAMGSRRELNALIGLPLDAATTVADDVPDGALPALDLTLSGNLGLQLLDRQLAEAEAKATLARAQQSPDPTFEAAVTHDSPPEFDYGWRAAVGLTIPVFTRHGASVRLADATVAKLRLAREAEADRLRGAVATAWTRADAQQRAYRRFQDDILPRTETVERMAEDSYKSGRTGLVALLQAMQAARDARMKAIESASAFQTAVADLERAALVGAK